MATPRERLVEAVYWRCWKYKWTLEWDEAVAQAMQFIRHSFSGGEMRKEADRIYDGSSRSWHRFINDVQKYGRRFHR